MAESETTQDVQTETQLPTAMYAPDEPEVEATDTEVPAVATEEQDVEAAEVDEEKPTEVEPKGHDRDKGLQKLQQRQSTFEKQVRDQIDGLNQNIQSVLEAIRDQGGRATPEQRAEVEEARDELDELLAGIGDDDEIVEAGKFRKAMSALRTKIGKTDDLKKVQALEQELAELKNRQQMQDAERQFYDGFDHENPSLKGKGPDLVRQANEEVDKDFPNLKGEYRQGALNVVFKRIVDEAKAKPAEPPRKASTTPPKSTTGTQTVATGASAARPAGTTKGRPAKPPMYVPD